MCKVPIRTIHGFWSCTNLRSKLCAASRWTIFECSLAHITRSYVSVCWLNDGPSWGIPCWKSLSFWEQGAKKKAQTKSCPSGAIPVTNALSMCVYCNTLLIINGSTFSIDTTLLSFSWFVSGGSALIYALNTSLGAIWGLDVWTIQELVIYQCFANFAGYNPKIVQPIQELLRKAWTWGLSWKIHRLPWSVLWA